MNENNIKSLFPEGVETIIISKNDYDRLYGQLTYENIVLQSKIDKAIEYINSQKKTISKSQADLFNEDRDNKPKLKVGTFMWNVDELLDILKENK